MKLGKDQELPARISRMTGITEDDLRKKGTSQRKVKQQLEKIIREYSGQLVWVIHYKQFEIPFLKKLLFGNPKSEKSFGEVICTHKLAKTIWPELPSHSIHAVSGFLGYSFPKVKRAQSHINATEIIWNTILEQESFSGSNSKAPQKGKSYGSLLKKEIRLQLPSSPGVYRYYAKDGTLLYVGKATDLKSRVNSYFRGKATKGSRLNEMLAQISEVKFDVVMSPFEAALLEVQSIQGLRPKYNVALSPDATPPIALTRNWDVARAREKALFFPLLLSPEIQLLDAIRSNRFSETYFSEFSRKSDFKAAAHRVCQNLEIPFKGKPTLKNLADGLITYSWKKIQTFDVKDEFEDIDMSALYEENFELFMEYAIEKCFLNIALASGKAKWLRRLSNCEISYTWKGRASRIEIQNARASFPAAHHLQKSAAPLNGDRADFNVLSVAFSELVKKSKTQGSQIKLRLHNGRTLDAAQLRQLLVNY